jgi:hypothetical protein
MPPVKKADPLLTYVSGFSILRSMAKTSMPKEMREYLAKIGSKGGKAGGAARAANMTPEERSAASRKAVQARWAKAKAPQKTS